MKKERALWGVLFILAGVFLIVSKLGYFGDINVFSILLSIVLLFIMIKSIFKVNFPGILFPLAFLAIIYDKELGITQITPWTVLIAALFGSIGLSILFRKNVRLSSKEFNKEDVHNIDCEDEGNILIDTSFGSSIKYVNSNNFEQADIDCSFGSLKVHFEKASMKGESAIIKFDVSFSGVELYIPKGWTIQNNTKFAFGGITEKNNNGGVITNTLVLTGDISFSGIDIFYV